MGRKPLALVGPCVPAQSTGHPRNLKSSVGSSESKKRRFEFAPHLAVGPASVWNGFARGFRVSSRLRILWGSFAS